MNKKNGTTVLIGGKTYNIAGYEDVDYLQKIATYINQRSEELKSGLGHNIINDAEKNVLIQINLADDYLKLKAQQELNSSDADDRSKEMSALKRDNVAMQTKLEAAENQIKTLTHENNELQKKIIRLETELSLKQEPSGARKGK
ncbi:MAG: cell division protein ZapA [Lachnospiraceae bacterium]|nr:cell division protein ZapA [Lachnospiraceae bacterium]MBP5250521.1 cell division protein ZapA [Lachnospiraceae bacterium]